MVMSVFKQLKDVLNLRVKCRTQNRNLEGSKIKMVADTKKERSGFIVYVKESRSVSMFQYNVRYLTHVFRCPTFTPLDSLSLSLSLSLYIYICIICIYIYIYSVLTNFFFLYFLFFYRTITTIKTGYPSLYLKLTYIVEMLDLF